MSEVDQLLLDVQDLTVEYSRGRRRPPLRAVDGVSFSLAPRETVGLVGESGSGKTTIGRAILGLAPVAAGAIRFAGEDITAASHKQRRELSADLQAVFQDPYSSLNPTRTIGQTLAEVLLVHNKLSRNEARARVREMLERVGLPTDAADRYPAHFSGGQRQRVAIARALMNQPRLVICDEPTSALDLSVQAQVLNLLRQLQHEFQLSYLFISHDLAVVRHLSHRIIVVYQGRIMEDGDADAIHRNPTHPYTQALLHAAPVPDPDEQRQRRAIRTRRTAAAHSYEPDACPFVDRCPHAIDICRTSRPPLDPTPGGTLVACHRWRELQAAHVVAPEPVQPWFRRVGVQENKKLAISFFEASFSGDFDRWESMMDDGFRYWNGGSWKDKAGYLDVAARLSQDLIEGLYTMEIGSVTAEDDRVVIEAETNYDVTCGRHYQNFYAWILEIRDGKILSLKGHTDTLHASRVFDEPRVSAVGDARESPVERVTQTLIGSTPQAPST